MCGARESGRVTKVPTHSVLDGGIGAQDVITRRNCNMSLLTRLPEDCVQSLFRALPLCDAATLSATCRQFRDLYLRTLPSLTSVLDLSHRRHMTDTALLSLLSQTNNSVQCLSLSHCVSLSASGIASALRLCARLQFLDLSALPAHCLDDAALRQYAPSLRYIRSLRITNAPYLPVHAIAFLRARLALRKLTALDLSGCSPEHCRVPPRALPALRSAFLPASPSDMYAHNSTYVNNATSMHRLKALVNALTHPLDAALVPRARLAVARAHVLHTGLLTERVAAADVSACRELVRAFSQDALEGGPRCALSRALDVTGVSCASRVELIRALLPVHRISLSRPSFSALLSLAAARADAHALQVLLPSSPVNFGETAVLSRALHAACARRTFTSFPPDSGLHAQSRSWLQRAAPPPSPPRISAAFASVNAIDAVLVLLQRGAPVTDDVLLTAANMGETDVLRAILYAREGQRASVHGGNEQLKCEGENVRNVVSKRLAARSEKGQGLLVAAASGSDPARAAETTRAILAAHADVADDTAECSNEQSLCLQAKKDIVRTKADPRAKLCAFRRAQRTRGTDALDCDAAVAISVALCNGNDSAARALLDARPRAATALAGSSRASQALHVIARRVGRGITSDADLLSVGKRVASAIAVHHGSNFADILKDAAGRSALHYAAAASEPSFTEVLLRLGAHVDSADADGASPLCTAVEARASRACLETLLNAGALVSVADARGRGPLHRAAEARNGAAAAVLLRFGADPVAPDRFGVAPVHIDGDLLHRASIFASAPLLLDGGAFAARANAQMRAEEEADVLHEEDDEEEELLAIGERAKWRLGRGR